MRRRFQTVFFLIIGLYSSISVAAPKELICVSSAEELADGMARAAKRYADPNYVAYSMENSKVFYGMAEMCKNSTYGWRHSYVFDTDGLKDNTTKNKAELVRLGCNGVSGPVLEVTMSATPSVITFISPEYPERFNINRSDLRAGKDTDRNFTCELRDVDLSGNLL